MAKVSSDVYRSSGCLDSLKLVPFGATYLTSQPITLSVTDLGYNNILQLNWSSVDGAVTYKIFKNLVPFANTSNTTFDDNIRHELQNTYSVVAIDEKGQQSSISNAVTINSPQATKLLAAIRALLKDNPMSFKTVLGSNTVNTQRWTDTELLIYAELATCDVNGLPSRTAFTATSLPDDLVCLVAERAAILAISAQGVFEITKEFGYSDTGISLQLDRSAKYSQYFSAMTTDWAQRASRTKRTYYPKPAGVQASIFSQRVRILHPAVLRLR